MVHSLLSGIPDIMDETPSTEDQSAGASDTLFDDDDVYEPLEEVDKQFTGLENIFDTDVDSTSNMHTIPDCVQGDPPSPLLSSQDENISPQPTEKILRYTEFPALENSNLFKSEPLDEKHPSPFLPTFPHRPTLTLTSILIRADELSTLYPPTHPSVSAASIMGPQSVIFTWSEDPEQLPPDDDAELIVQRPELIVLPYVEPDDADGKESDDRDKGRDTDRWKLLHTPLRIGGINVKTRTLVAGAVLVLGVGLAVYGFRTRSVSPLGPSGAGYPGGRGHDWKRARVWIGKAVAGII
jgi:hypothetical protein